MRKESKVERGSGRVEKRNGYRLRREIGIGGIKKQGEEGKNMGSERSFG
jgi:hypothetical protein